MTGSGPVPPADEPTARTQTVGDLQLGLPERFDLPGPAAAPPPAAGPTRFGKYEVTAELGEGGMGRVYKAFDPSLRRHVAVKALVRVDEFALGRLREEAELVARFDHPNIVKVFDVDTTGARKFIVLELAEGGSLDKLLRGEPQEPRWAAETAETLARAVHHAHERGVLHRDLKPANVLLPDDGGPDKKSRAPKAVKVTDFGLGKQLDVTSGYTRTGDVMGTPSYMAPEQAAGAVKAFGPATDVYGLGAILYEMLTGRPPFRGVNLIDTLEQVQWADPAPPSRLVPRLHKDLGTICLTCLQKAPGRRYPSAQALADDLRRWLNGETIVARPAPAWERGWRHVRRRPWQAATIGAAGLAVVLAVGGGLYARDRQQAWDHERQFQDQEAAARAARAAEQEAAAARLRARDKQSLAALNGIRDLVLTGDLSRVAGLDPLNRELFAYYQRLIGQRREEGGADPAELADACTKLGELIGRTGDKSQARRAYEDADRLYQALGDDAPDVRRRRAAAQREVGRLAFEQGDFPAALAACDAARGLWARLKADAPGAAEFLTGEAEAWHLRGELHLRDRDPKAAAAAYEEAIRLRAEVARDDVARPEADLRRLSAAVRQAAARRLGDLARGHGYLGDALLEQRELLKADRAYWESHQLRERAEEALRPAPAGAQGAAPGADVAEWQAGVFQLARSWDNFANFQTRRRALATARHFASRAHDLKDGLVKDNPNVVRYKLDLWDTRNRLADLSLLLGDPDGAARLLADADRALPRDDGSRKDGRSDAARRTAAEAHALLAQAVADADPKRAGDAARAARGLLDELCTGPAARPRPRELFVRAAVLALQAELDGAAGADGRRDAALAALAKAADAGYRDKHPDDIRQLRAFKDLKDDGRFKSLVRGIDPD